jgi:dCMP deaminase
MYVTHFPCLHCCKAIIQSGITAVYYAQEYKNHPYAVELFQQAGVKVRHVPLAYTVTTLEEKDMASQLRDLLSAVDEQTEPEELRRLLQEAKQFIKR